MFFYSANYFAYSTFIDRFWDHRNEGVELCCSQWLMVRCFIMAHCIWILLCMNFQRATECKSSSLQQCKESLKPCNTVICAQEQVEIATSIFKRCFWKLILHTKHNLPNVFTPKIWLQGSVIIVFDALSLNTLNSKWPCEKRFKFTWRKKVFL